MKNNTGVAILGSTGSGKTSIAIEVARRLHGEIISCDSMQIYKDMDIGTAKATAAEQLQCPHHLIDFLDIHEPYNAQMFVEQASKCIEEIQNRGHLPILAGGTGLYARALLYGMDMLPSDKKIAAELIAAHKNGQYSLLDRELQEKDPRTYEKIHHNWRRVIRALEVIRLTGKPLDPTQEQWQDTPACGFPQFVLMYSPEKLRERIAKRTAEMVEEGWIEEAKKLFKMGLFETPTAHQALGYSVIYDYLNPKPRPANEKDQIMHSEADLIERLTIKTCQYAKRQRTWFRNKHADAFFIDMDNTSKEEAVDLICSKLESENE